MKTRKGTVRLLVLSLTPILGAGFIAAIDETAKAPEIEYGALGLCAVIVLFLCRHIGQLSTELKETRTENSELLKDNNRAMNRIAEMLFDRPCLMKDHRIKDNGSH